MAVVITSVKLSKQTVETKEVFRMSVAVKESAQEPKMYRLPFKLGTSKGGVKSMAKATLPTNYKDDIMASSMAGKRRYNMIQNSDGTISS